MSIPYWAREIVEDAVDYLYQAYSDRDLTVEDVIELAIERGMEIEREGNEP